MNPKARNPETLSKRPPRAERPRRLESQLRAHGLEVRRGGHRPGRPRLCQRDRPRLYLVPRQSLQGVEEDQGGRNGDCVTITD